MPYSGEGDPMYTLYAIVNTDTYRAYIGITPKYRQRRYEHIKRLREQWHSNRELQADWNDCGEDRFRFVRIKEIDRDTRLAVEGAHIVAWKYGTYNLNRNKKAMGRVPVQAEIDYPSLLTFGGCS
jgi:hypothetical protein